MEILETVVESKYDCPGRNLSTVSGVDVRGSITSRSRDAEVNVLGTVKVSVFCANSIQGNSLTI